MTKRNENHGRSMPKDIVSMKRNNMTNNDTMNIVEFLYPTFPPSRRRYPLTRCLLGCLIENIKHYEPEENHNFKTVAYYLNDLLSDMNNTENKTAKDKLVLLRKIFYTDDYGGDLEYRGISRVGQEINLPEWALDMFDLFYYYDKLESQQYAAAGLLYDLIPLMNVSFAEVTNSLDSGLQAMLDFQKKAAMYKGDNVALLMHRMREVSGKLFSYAEPIKQSVFQLAVLKAMDKHGELSFDFSMKHVLRALMDAYRYIAYPLYQYNNIDCQLTDLARMLNNIAESASSQQNIIMNVAERIMLIDENVITLCNAAENSSRRSDEFFF